MLKVREFHGVYRYRASVERAPTIRDVARAAGVGASTVSLALRNDPRLRPAMRDHVRRVASEIGYLPNATLSSLMAQVRVGKNTPFQATLGFVNASQEPTILREVPTFHEWTRGATERARELGYSMDHFWLHEPGCGPARLSEILRTRGIRGLILAGLQNNGILPASHAEMWAAFSTVVIGLRPHEPPLHFTANDQFSTARHAVAELRKLGYTRLGLVIDPRIDVWLERRFRAGFFSEDDGLERAVFDFRKSEREAFGRWLRATRPNALVSLHAEIKEWLENSADPQLRGIALVHLDRLSSMSDWAGMDQNNFCVGATATDMVVGMLHRNELGVPEFARATLLPSKWVAGATASSHEKRVTSQNAPRIKTKRVARTQKTKSRIGQPQLKR